jgi:hypothetical protein
MKHAFRFPLAARKTLKNHITRAIDSVDPNSFHQEPIYVAALAKSLDGVIYDQEDAFIEIKSTIVDSIGPKSAEKWSGADLAITATIMNNQQKVAKAILIQSKLGRIEEMSPSKKTKLIEQITNMKNLTRSPKVMVIINRGDHRSVKIISGNKIKSVKPYKSFDLSDYFTMRILTTFDGDTRQHFITGVKDHTLQQLHIYARTNLP